MVTLSNFEWLLDAAAKSFALTAVTCVLASCLRRQSAATLHRLWSLCFAGCLAMPAISAVMPEWRLPIMPASRGQSENAVTNEQATGRTVRAASSAVADHVAASAPRGERSTPRGRAGGEPVVVSLPLAMDVTASEPTAPAAAGDSPASIDGTAVLLGGLAAWTAVVGVLVARMATDWLRLRSILRACRPLDQAAWAAAAADAMRRLDLSRPVRLLKHPECASPFTAGVFRPVVVAPAAAEGWSAAERSSVLLHELAHVKRHDVLTQFVAGCACATYWFNPLCWWGLAQMRRLRELACDDVVLAGGQAPADYADVLLGVARAYRHRRLSCAVGMAHQSNVERRIMAILDAARNRVPLSGRGAAFLAAAATAIVVVLGSVRLEDRADAAEDAETDPPTVAADSSPEKADGDGASGPEISVGPDEQVMEVLVTDESDAPLAGAKVHMSVWEMDRSNGKEYPNRDYEADERGIARIVLPRRLYILRLWPSAPGYVPEFINFDSEPDDVISEEIPPRYHFKLASGTVLSGTIVDETGAPVPGAKVDVRVDVREPAWGSNPEPMISTWLGDEVTTDEAGRWSIDDAPAKREGTDYEFQLMIVHDDYVRDAQWGELQRAQGVTTEMLRDGSARIVLRKGMPITGTVVDRAGAAVTKGLVIWNDRPYWAEGVNETQLDEQGRFATIPLPPGEYPITVVAPGFRPEQRRVTVEAALKPQEFMLGEGNRLAIKIVNQAGEPLSKSRVMLGEWLGTEALYNHDHSKVLDSGIPRRPDENGLYVWDWAPDGPVSYTISAIGYAPRTVALVANGGEHVVELAPPLTVRGSVTDARTGAPVEKFRVIPVTVFRPQFFSILFQDIVKAEHGQYEIPIHVNPEQEDYRYTVRVEAKGYRSAMSETSFGVRDGAVVQDFTLEPAAALEGVVIGPDGEPVDGATVVVGTPSIVPMTDDGEVERYEAEPITTSSGGRFALAATFEPMRIRAMHASGFAEVLRAVDEPIGRLTLQPWARLSGRLVQDGRPVTDQNVIFSPLPDRGLGEARFQDSYQMRTDPDGRFDFERVPPIPGNLRASLGPWRESPLTSSESAPVNLQPGEHREVTLGGRRGVTVTGRVAAIGRGDVPLDRNWSLNYLVSRDRGIPLPQDVKLGFDPSGTIETPWLSDPEFHDWLATRENYFVKLSPEGQLRISGVPAGKYDLVLQLYEQPAGCLVQTVGERIVPIEVTSADLAAGGKDVGTIEVACRVGPRVGENMQAYAFVDASGRQRYVADLRGRLVLLHVWASWCEPCVASMPELVATAEDLADAPVTLIGLNIDADAAAGQRLAEAKGLNWSQNYLGEDSDTARQLAVSTAPAYFLIGADGTLLRSSTEWSEIKSALEAALVGDLAAAQPPDQ